MKVTSIFRRLLYLNTVPQQDPIEKQKTYVTNFLLLAVSVLAIILAIVNAFYGLYHMALLDLSIIVFFIVPCFTLQYFNKSLIASYYLLIGLAILTYIGSITAYSEQRFTGTENLFIGYSLMVIVLFEKRHRINLLVLTIVALFFLKFQKYDTTDSAFQITHILDLTNTMMLLTISCYLVWVFKNVLFEVARTSILQEKKVYSLIDNLPLFIGMINREGKYIIVNEQYEQGFFLPRKEIIGKHYKDVVPYAAMKNHSPLVENAFKGKTPSFLEEELFPDGSKSYVSGKYYPIFDDNFEVNFVTVYVTDITDLKRTENKLVEANKARNQLFSIISHDLRSPLILLHNILKISEIQELSAEEFSIFTKDVERKLKTVLNTVDNVLNWARSQMDQIKNYPEKVSLNEIIAENIMLHEPLASKKGLQIGFKPEKDYKVFADPNHVSLIFRNLIHNSLKFTEEGGIDFDFKEENGHLKITMKDTGVGMDNQTIKDLLNTEKIQSTEGTNGEMGTGLGMSVSLELLKMNEGEISIISHKNSGSSFEIKLPVN